MEGSGWKSLTIAVESSIIDGTWSLDLPLNKYLHVNNLINCPLPSKSSRAFDGANKGSNINTSKVDKQINK